MVEEKELQDRLPSGLLVNTCLHPCITLSVWIWLDQGLFCQDLLAMVGLQALTRARWGQEIDEEQVGQDYLQQSRW